MRRNAVALQIPLNDLPIIREIDDIDACDLVYGDAEDEPDIVDMIEQEFCFVGPIHSHTYLNGSNYCHKCGTAHPSIRNACGQR